MKTNKLKDNILDFLLAFIPMLLLFSWILFFWKITYSLHDDNYMISFASGKYLGHPDAHLIYIKYPLSYLLSYLYTAVPSIDWYGCMLITYNMISLFFITFYFIKKQNTLIKKIIVDVAIYIILLSGWFSELVSFTYTTTAALLGVAMLVIFTLSSNRFIEQLLTLFLAFICYNLRSEIFIMLLPFCGIIWLYKFLTSKRKEHLFFLISLFIIIGCSFTINTLAYSTKDWKDYLEYNENRTLVYDYYYDNGVFDYEQNKELYNKLNLTKTECEVMHNYDLSLYDSELYHIVEILPNHFKLNIPLLSKIKKGYTAITDFKTFMFISILLWTFAFLLVLRNKTKDILITMFGFILFDIILWSYLIFRGRLLSRVVCSMILVQLFSALLFIIMSTERKENILSVLSQKKKHCLLYITMLILAGLSLFDLQTIRMQWHKNNREASYQDITYIENYCNAHPENNYFIDPEAICERKDNFQLTFNNDYENYIILGDWFGNSPLYNQKLEAEGIKSVKEAVYSSSNSFVIVRSAKDATYIADASHSGATLKVIDTIKGGRNGFTVYKLN